MKFSSVVATSLAIAPALAFVQPRYRQVAHNAPLRSSDSVVVERTDSTTKESERRLYDPMGLYPKSSAERQEGRIRNLESDLFQNNANDNNDGPDSRPLYDPLSLYPSDSPEREQGRIQPLETPVTQANAVRDPLGLYPSNVATEGETIEETASNTPRSGRIYDPMGLYPKKSEERVNGKISNLEQDLFGPSAIEDDESSTPIYDPLRLYPEDAPERTEGLIQPLESTTTTDNAVFDPMGLYPTSSTTDDKTKVKSQALPFMERPATLTGELPGDYGFDPFGFASTKDKLLELREAEIKHSRLAMLAAVGWPLSELWDKQLAAMTHLQPILGDGDRVPSILNGGLEKVSPVYWAVILAAASCIEIFGPLRQQGVEEGDRYVAGNLSFDPLGLYPKDVQGQEKMQLSEIKHGRLAMLAITMYVLQEFVTKMGVVNMTPFLFHSPLN